MRGRSATSWAFPTTSLTRRRSFRSTVIQYFADEYKAGRTPESVRDVQSESEVRPAHLTARINSAREFIATGHFARMERAHPSSAHRMGRGWRSRVRGGICSSADAICRRTKAIFSSRCGRINWRAPCFRSAKRPRATRAKWRGIAISRPPTRRRAWKSVSCRTTITAAFCRQANLVQKHRGEIVDLRGQVLGHHDGHRVLHHRPAQGAGPFLAPAALRDRTGCGEQPRGGGR